MGLDISAFAGLTKLVVSVENDEPTDPETGEYVDYDLHVFDNTYFPGRAEGLEDKAYYVADKQLSFRAGSYSSYNFWREDLARLAGYKLGEYTSWSKKTNTSHCVSCWNGEQGPFAELINFTDCDGTIGHIVSAKLAKDFSDFQEKANQFSWRRSGGLELYNEWRKAFELASNNGAVRFH